MLQTGAGSTPSEPPVQNPRPRTEAGRPGASLCLRELEDQFRSELQDARQWVRVNLKKARIPENFIRVASSRSATTIHGSPLRVVEHVEGFCAELEGQAFLNCKVLEQRHIEVRAAGIAEYVSADISESESARGRKGIWVVEHLSTQTWF